MRILLNVVSGALIIFSFFLLLGVHGGIVYERARPSEEMLIAIVGIGVLGAGLRMLALKIGGSSVSGKYPEATLAQSVVLRLLRVIEILLWLPATFVFLTSILPLMLNSTTGPGEPFSARSWITRGTLILLPIALRILRLVYWGRILSS